MAKKGNSMGSGPKNSPPPAPKFSNSAAGRKNNLDKVKSPPPAMKNPPNPPAGMAEPLAPKRGKSSF